MAKHTPESPLQGAVPFDLASIAAEMRQEDAYVKEGHVARTLVRESDLRVLLVVMKAGSRMAEHRVAETASIHAISGLVQLRLPARRDVQPGELLVLERGLKHDVEAIADSVFLLTLGWHDKM